VDKQEDSLKVITCCEEESFLLGKKIGKSLKLGDAVFLYGELGAGKTVLVKGICSGAGVEEGVYITSPTFSIVNVYPGKITVHHIDLYRLEEVNFEEVPIWEYLQSGIVVVEWAERLKNFKPENLLEVQISYVDELKREFILKGFGRLQGLPKALDVDDLCKDL